MFDFIIQRIKIDWWEVTHLGLAGYFSFAWDWVKYLLGASSIKPNFFSYSERDMDLDFDFSDDDKEDF